MPNLDDHFTKDALEAILERLLDGHFDVIAERPRISTGADRLELDLFMRDKDKHLAAASRKVLSGRYTFSPFLERQIPKDGTTEMRTISIASIRDSIVQRGLYDYLYSFVDALLKDGVVFGYRKGVSAHDAIHAIKHHFQKGRTYVFEADLEKFFDTVDHDILLAKVSSLQIDERVETLVRRFLKTGKIPSEQVEEHRVSKGKRRKYTPEMRHKGVPQGGVLSGLLSNLYLAEFDGSILEHHAGLVRYADDFLVCCIGEQECQAAHALATSLLTPLKVNLHPSQKKTKICVRAESGVEFLGFNITPNTIRVRGRNIAKFKDRIRRVIESQKLKTTPELTLKSLCWRLAFKIRGPNEAQLKKLAERGRKISVAQRSWIGFFRIVDDMEQIRLMDRWIRQQITQFMWKNHKVRVRAKDMQEYGLPSLVNSLWKARRPKPLDHED